MGFVFIPPTIVGGTVLVISDIRSQNYVTGVSGWAIFANGDAEFFSVVIRGDLITGTGPPDPHIEILRIPGDRIEFYTGNADETAPGYLKVGASGGNADVELRPSITTGVGAHFSYLRLSNPFASAVSQAFLHASTISLTTDDSGVEVVNDPTLSLGWWASSGEFWHVVGTGGEPAFAGNWAVSGGFNVAFRRDASGRVQLRGRAQETVAASTTIFTLPAGYRPTQTVSFPVKSNNDGGTISWLSVSTAGVVSLLGNVAQGRVQTILDNVSFPTF